jgi:DNA-3-methyladenine glycosylase II
MATFTLAAQGPFALAASTRFLEGFAPAGYTAAAAGPLELAFPVEGSWPTAGVRVREHPHGVKGEILSPARPSRELATAIRDQVARILSLDVDGSGFAAVGTADPVVAGLQHRYPGLRPVGFWSPYEAAAWAIISQRIRIRQATTVKARMSERLGAPVSFGDHVVHAFPAPQQLVTLDGFGGLSGRKPEWLRSLAAVPHLGHAAAAGPAGGRNRRDQRPEYLTPHRAIRGNENPRSKVSECTTVTVSDAAPTRPSTR